MLSRAKRRGLFVRAALPAPALFIVAGAIAYPLGLELWWSLSDAQVGQLGHFVGLANYAYLLRQPTYHDALRNTLVLAILSQASVIVLASTLESVSISGDSVDATVTV